MSRARAGDWFARALPADIEVGENTVIGSSFCFKHYFARSQVGLRVGSHVTIGARDVPPYAEAVGDPARVVRDLEPDAADAVRERARLEYAR